MSYYYGPSLVKDGLVLCLDAANPKSYVSGSNTWYDLSGNKNGTLTNSPTYNTSSKGSIVFDGIDDYVAINGNTFGYSPGTTGELSLEAWVYPTGPFSSYTNEPPITNLTGIFGEGYYGGVNGWGLGIIVRSDIGNCWSFQVRNDTTIVEAGNQSSAAFVTGSWFHIVGSFTRNDFSRLYVNGKLASSGSSTALNGISITPNSNNAQLGRVNSGLSFFYGGRISVAKLYNRPLSSQEVLQNYNATKGRYNL